MANRPTLTPCIICEITITYLWDETHNLKNVVEIPNLNYAIDIDLCAGYGSIHDGDMYTAIICDTCMTTLIDKKLVTHKGNYIHGHINN
jgi:hypothetical protein